jgi:REP element-mobilizing transposase RayT
VTKVQRCFHIRRQPGEVAATVEDVPRPLRQWIAGGVYHVFSRGSNRQAVFVHDTDRIDLLGCAERVIERHDIECLAFGLMPNHCHWLFRIPLGDDRLSWAMKELNGRYSLRFNRRYRREAHLFRNRFGAVCQESEDQLRWTVRYIVRNPVEAELCADPSELPWTSHRATAQIDPPPRFLAISTLLSYFGDTTEAAVARYVEFVSGEPANPGV